MGTRQNVVTYPKRSTSANEVRFLVPTVARRRNGTYEAMRGAVCSLYKPSSESGGLAAPQKNHEQDGWNLHRRFAEHCKI